MKTRIFILLFTLLSLQSLLKAETEWLTQKKLINGKDTLFLKYQDHYFYFGIANKIKIWDNSGKNIVVKVSSGTVIKGSDNVYEIFPGRLGEMVVEIISNSRFQLKRMVLNIPDPWIIFTGSPNRYNITMDEIENGKFIGGDFKVIGFKLSGTLNGFVQDFEVNDNKFNKDHIKFLRKLLESGNRKFYIEEIKVHGPDSFKRIIEQVMVYRICSSKVEAMIRNGEISEMPLLTNLRIKITGKPTKEDIQTVKNIVAALDSLTESIDVKLVDHFPSYIINFDSTDNYSAFDQNDMFTAKIQEKSLFFFPYHSKTTVNLSLRKTNQKNRSVFLWYHITNHLVHLGLFSRYNQNSIFDGDIKITNGLTEKDKHLLKLIFSKKGQKEIKEQLTQKLSKGSSSRTLLIILLSVVLFLITMEIENYYRLSKKIRNALLRNLISYALISQLVLLSMCILSGIENMSLQRFILPFALICGFTFYFIDSFLKSLKKSWTLLLAEPILTICALFICYQLVYLFTRGEFLKTQYVNETSLLIVFSIVIVRFLMRYQTIKVGQIIREKDIKISQQKEVILRTELNALQARINPHFLYNSLNSIAELAATSAKRTEEMALSLSRLFQYNLNRSNSMVAKISDEIEMVKLYLFVEKQRFSDKLNYEIDVDKTAEEREVPKFLLQPLVENAVKHGISKNLDKGNIRIEIRETNQNISIKIYDSGPDFPEGIINGYGLQNIYEKLDLVYQKPYEVRFVNGINKHIYLLLKNGK